MSNRPTWRGTLACLCLMPAVSLFFVLVFTPAGGAFADTRNTGLVWLEYEAGLAHAGKEKKFIMADFHTPWCRDCKKMDKDVFSDPGVIKKLQAGFIPVKVDADQRQDLSSKFGVFGYPTVFVLDSRGATVCQRAGYMSREEFTLFMDYALTGAYKNSSYLEYYNSRRK